MDSARLPVGEEALHLLSRASTATLTTQLFKRGLRNTFLFGLKPLNPQAARFVGEAFTLRTIPVREDLDTMEILKDPNHPQRKAIETVGPGEVFVVDSRGDPRGALTGDILVTRMRRRGAVALVTDGSVRDSPAIARMDFPVHTAAVTAMLSLGAHHAVDFQVPIACAGVAVYPGDILVGDEEGVVCIPRHLAAEIAAPAAEQEQFEVFILHKIEQGAPLAGTYPANTQTQEEYRAWKQQQAEHNH